LLPKPLISELAEERRFSFSLERAVFLTVSHRLFAPGSDRAADKWRRDQILDGTSELELHQLYRAMAWLGEKLPKGEQRGKTPFAPRCVKDLIEEKLFQSRRDLFSDLALVLMDSTSIYFYGKGGKTLGQRGYSRDKRPDLRQMVVAMILDGNGRPICCELWPGNVTDMGSLVPVVDRLRLKFGVKKVCIVADRGMLSADTVQELESNKRGWSYILGARIRNVKEIREQVLGRGGRYTVVDQGEREPLKVKEVKVEDRRYIVCINEAQRAKDEAARAAIIESLTRKLKQGDKVLVGNTGYRRYLTKGGRHFEIDRDAIAREQRYDGKWVLRTNTDWSPAEAALRYKQLWMVEHTFRELKSLLETRPVFHRTDEAIRGHVFCSFLALVVRNELVQRVAAVDPTVEWRDIIRDLAQVTATDVAVGGQAFRLRAPLRGAASVVFKALKLSPPPTLEKI